MDSCAFHGKVASYNDVNLAWRAFTIGQTEGVYHPKPVLFE
jgi:hypothetical protein